MCVYMLLRIQLVKYGQQRPVYLVMFTVCRVERPRLIYMYGVSRYDNGISMAQFRLCMKQYRSRFTEKQIVLFYHSLNRSGSGALSLEEFYDFFEFLQLRWHRKGYSEGV